MWLIEHPRSNKCGFFKRVVIRICHTHSSKQYYNVVWNWRHENLTHFLSTNCTLTSLSGMVTTLMNGSTFSASGVWEMSNCCTILAISRWSSYSAIRRPRHIRVPNPNGREAKASADSIRAVSLFCNHVSGLNASASSKNTLISPYLVSKEFHLSSDPRDMVAP